MVKLKMGYGNVDNLEENIDSFINYFVALLDCIKVNLYYCKLYL
jgi:hypothetical protein